MELTLPQNTLPLRAQWTLQYRGAAIRCVAQIIVTKNLKNFPSDVLDQYGIEAQHPDEFLEYQFGLRPNLVISQSWQCSGNNHFKHVLAVA